ncbi:HERV-H LTR-associating protein 1 [Hoplias malabaricus]|uniref:HERV-H LTR-associating protein 1 n=1 Tax=Hoplias malabaricus TaxID=27720 RepID=UPI003462C975
MAKVKLSQWVYMRVSVAIVTLLPICITVLKHRELEQREKRDILASTEIPVEYIDPASIDLTPLVNTLINATHTGSLHLFSVLSVTSHSSLALHKLTLLVYNISNFQDIESSLFPTRYCYCVTNKTNDLTDFTAILLDVMGNSTSYLQELFKSSSILSVSQRNSSECIYICVMAGKTDRDLSKLWDSVPPLFNHTIIEDTHKVSMTTISSGATSHTVIKTPATIAKATPPTTATTVTNPAIFKILTTDTAGCPWRAELFYQGNQREDLIGNRPTVSTLKLQPCVFELCKFFSQCLCRGYSHKTFLQSYCTESHVWYEKHTVEVCSRVRRVAFSRNLKQKCLSRMCV